MIGVQLSGLEAAKTKAVWKSLVENGFSADNKNSFTIVGNDWHEYEIAVISWDVIVVDIATPEEMDTISDWMA